MVMASLEMNHEPSIMNLPVEMTISVLSRLPVRAIVSCMCVCKKWREIVSTPEFVKSQIAFSTAGVAVFVSGITSESLEVYDFVDDPDSDHREPVVTLDLQELIPLPHHCPVMECSIDGLVFIRQINHSPNLLNICNPITGECITISGPDRAVTYPTVVTYGFGFSAISEEYKIVRIRHDRVLGETHQYSCVDLPKPDCQIFTLGTGSWRNIAPDVSFAYDCRSTGVFLNGHLHWIVTDLNGSCSISRLNLGTELFSHLSLPPCRPKHSRFIWSLNALGGHLCVCNNCSESEIEIWIMKEYGITSSWAKEFVIKKHPDQAGEFYEAVYPLKVFLDGKILMLWGDFYMFTYSQRDQTVEWDDMFVRSVSYCTQAVLHSSSILSPKKLCGHTD